MSEVVNSCMANQEIRNKIMVLQRYVSLLVLLTIKILCLYLFSFRYLDIAWKVY